MSNELTITAGKNFNHRFVFKGCEKVWGSLDLFEIRAQLRADENTSGLLIGNLHDYMTASYEYQINADDDINIDWVMNGQQTRALFNQRWGNGKTGYFNLILSDKGTDDAHALVMPTFKVYGKDMTTLASGVT